MNWPWGKRLQPDQGTNWINFEPVQKIPSIQKLCRLSFSLSSTPHYSCTIWQFDKDVV